MFAASSKRTRSQLALPDLILNLPLHRSPLKDARSALRNQDHHRPAMDPPNTSESEDEILLSPRIMKRDGEGDGGGREYKRRRHDARLSPFQAVSIRDAKDDAVDENQVISAPPVTTTTGVSRSRSTAGRTATQSSYTRARSVPSFPSAPSEPSPHLDLRATIPASPKKPRPGSLPPPVSPRKEPDVIMASPPPPSILVPPTIQPVPTTPINTVPHLAFSLQSPMSPLTPLPPTPLPPGPFKFGSNINTTPPVYGSSQHKKLGKAKGKGSSLRETLFLASMKTPPPSTQPSSIPRPKTPTKEQEHDPKPVPGPSTISSSYTSPSKIPTAISSSLNNPRLKSPVKFLPVSISPVKTAPFGEKKMKAKPKAVTIGGGGRVTRSVSMREKKLKEAGGGGDKRKSGSAGFAAPTSSSAAKASPVKGTAAGPSRPSSPSKPKQSVRPSSSSSFNYPRTGPPNSLSNLSIALEKLNLPPPSRPGMGRAKSSLGFNRDGGGEDGEEGEDIGGKDGNGIGVGMGRPSGSGTGLARSRTLHERAFSGPAGGPSSSSSSVVPPSSSMAKITPAGEKAKAQVGIQRYFAPKGSVGGGVGGGNGGKGNLGPGSGVGGVGAGGMRTKGTFGFGGTGVGMGIGGRMGSKASQKTSLPSVADTPVKGSGREMLLEEGMRTPKNGDAGTGMETGEEHVVKDGDVSVDLSGEDDIGVGIEGQKEKGKEKQRSAGDAWRKNASRRASMASQALSQSLSSLPELQQPQQTRSPPLRKLGSMGPPPLAMVTRAASSSYPSSSALSPGLGKGKGKEGGEVMLKVLKECTIFVDVRTDEGDDAGSLFVDMLRGMGARILQRVGQTCTHIVYKNGLMSTLTRYRLLNEPRPKVVGIAWVVECVEQRALVEETKFMIEVEDMNVGGMNKRRRSMLPKTIPVGSYGGPRGVTSPMSTTSWHEPGDESVGRADQSMDGSSSSIVMDDDDDLPPLEKARRRRLGNLPTARS